MNSGQNDPTIAGVVAGLEMGAVAANAIPVAGQAASAALGLGALLTKIFGGKKKEKEAQAKAAQEFFLKQREARLSQFAQPPQQPVPTQQGMGGFQQAQQMGTAAQGVSFYGGGR